MDVGQYFCSPFQREGNSGDRGEREALQALCSWVGDRIQEEGLALARSTHNSPIVDHWRERRAGHPGQGSRLSWGWESKGFTFCWPLFSKCNRKQDGRL